MRTFKIFTWEVLSHAKIYTRIFRSYTHDYLYQCTYAHKFNCQSIKRCQISCNTAACILSIALMVDNSQGKRMKMDRGEWTLELGRRYLTVLNRQLYIIGTFYQTVYILQQVDTVWLPPLNLTLSRSLVCYLELRQLMKMYCSMYYLTALFPRHRSSTHNRPVTLVKCVLLLERYNVAYSLRSLTCV